jgi:hypothetical protein
MHARRVHAVMAAGLSDPHRLEDWRNRPEAIRLMADCLEPAEAEKFVDGLWKFGGLGEKIRHTNCRGDLPLTFRLLNFGGMEIEVFGNLARHAAALRAQGKKSARDKIANLIAFLRDWHDPRNRNHVLLWDLIRHEATLAEFDHCEGSQRSDCGSGLVSGSSIPRFAGSVRLHRMRFDPRRTALELRKELPNLSAIENSPVCLAYWLNPEGRIQLLDVDALVFDLLSLVGRSLTISSIAQQFSRCGATISIELTVRAFSALHQVGVIAVE